VLRRTLNLGILAHVDAGKTTLTERLLYAAGVIDAIGSVDAGTTQTDSLALERRRGITIKSAVASFPVDDVRVNLIDTPGHPDFIAEVERVLSVLDGVVLVVSAVEGVQAQTRVLMRALQRLGLPTLLFVNKVDRRGADCERVLGEIRDRLTPSAIALGWVGGQGTRDAVYTEHPRGDAALASRLVDLLAEHDDAFLAAYLEDETGVSPGRLHDELAAQTKRALVHPVLFGSAITGAGVDALRAAVTRLLPATAGEADGPVSARVFKVERGAAGEKVAYARLFSGTIRVRDRLRFRRDGSEADGEAKVTAIGVFEGGSAVRSPSVAAGQIGKLWGLAEIRIGDAIGEPGPRAAARRSFAPPTLESVVVPRRGGDRSALYVALTRLAEGDPLIDVRRDDDRREISVSLYGEVQKEVIGATLADDSGIEVEFRETTPICVERPTGSGEAAEILGKESNPFLATVGLRVERAPVAAGVAFRTDVEVGSIPLYVYRSVEVFAEAVEKTVRETLRQGLYGWEVTDCTVTLTRSGYSAPVTTAGDFRKLTPLVLMEALKQAGTEVCEPIHRFRVDGPADSLEPTLRVLARLRAEPRASTISERSFALEGEIAAARMHLLQQRLGAATHGEGVLELAFARYEPVAGTIPTRPRSDHNPLNRDDYLLRLAGRVDPRGAG
jgi:ribosomal protection tetracycline resistance protein